MNCCLSICRKVSSSSLKQKNSNPQINTPTSKRRSMLPSKNDNRMVERNSIAQSSLQPLYELKDKFRCLFCGGAACKHENWKNNPNTPIIGLNCDQIADSLFASQRPSTMLIHEYNLIKKIKE
jgi:hypothetical protein